MEIQVKRLPHAAGLPLPSYGTEGAAGLDLYAAIPEGEEWTFWGHGMLSVPTGICVKIPDGNLGLCIPRSGLARHHQITVANAPGLIDSDYTGEINVLLACHTGSSGCRFRLKRGYRIAQLVILPYPMIQLREVDELPFSKRGAGGFGSTGS